MTSLQKRYTYAQKIQKAIRFKDIRNFEIHITGSVARKEDKVNDYDFLVLTKHKVDILKGLYFTKSSGITVIKDKRDRCGQHACMMKVLMPDGAKLKVDVFYNTLSNKAFALLHHIGPKSYNIRIRRIAREKCNLLLNQYGLFDRDTDKKITKKFKTVGDIQDYLGVTRRSADKRR